MTNTNIANVCVHILLHYDDCIMGITKAKYILGTHYHFRLPGYTPELHHITQAQVALFPGPTKESQVDSLCKARKPV